MTALLAAIQPLHSQQCNVFIQIVIRIIEPTQGTLVRIQCTVLLIGQLAIERPSNKIDSPMKQRLGGDSTDFTKAHLRSR